MSFLVICCAARPVALSVPPDTTMTPASVMTAAWPQRLDHMGVSLSMSGPASCAQVTPPSDVAHTSLMVSVLSRPGACRSCVMPPIT